MRLKSKYTEYESTRFKPGDLITGDPSQFDEFFLGRVTKISKGWWKEFGLWDRLTMGGKGFGSPPIVEFEDLLGNAPKHLVCEAPHAIHDVDLVLALPSVIEELQSKKEKNKCKQ